MNKPQLTVVMPVFNGERYLQEAIDSVLNQTFTDFTLLIINDGSNDNTGNILDSITDTRVQVINNGKNRGIAYCRNLALRLAKSTYLTWTDCDDINELTRFEQQVSFLNEHTSIAICGTALARFGNQERYIFRPETDSELLRAILVFRPSIPNATAMLRLSHILSFNIQYNVGLPIAEDYDFIFSCSQVLNLASLRSVLYRYRASETSIMKSVASDQLKQKQVHYTVYRRILAYLGFPPTDEQLHLHYTITSEHLIHSRRDLTMCIAWLVELLAANTRTGRYNQIAFKRAVSQEFYYVCKKSSPLGLQVLTVYLKYCLSVFEISSPLKLAKLIGRCALRKNKI